MLTSSQERSRFPVAFLIGVIIVGALVAGAVVLSRYSEPAGPHPLDEPVDDEDRVEGLEHRGGDPSAVEQQRHPDDVDADPGEPVSAGARHRNDIELGQRHEIPCPDQEALHARRVGVRGDVELDAVVLVGLVLEQGLGRGDALATEDMVDALRELLVPQASIVTPNSIEARRLTERDDDEEEPGLDECAHRLHALGWEDVLVQGAHEATAEGVNML